MGCFRQVQISLPNSLQLQVSQKITVYFYIGTKQHPAGGKEFFFLGKCKLSGIQHLNPNSANTRTPSEEAGQRSALDRQSFNPIPGFGIFTEQRSMVLFMAGVNQ